ncbi:3321_t:CDS:2, partial [Dentiscutata heterogama]
DDSRVLFKPKNSREEFFVYADPDMVQQWRKDKTVPLVNVVQCFEIFETYNGGKDGIVGHPSKQKLENAFGTSDNQEVIQQIIQEGVIHNAHKGHERPTLKDQKAVMNESRGRGAATN